MISSAPPLDVEGKDFYNQANGSAEWSAWMARALEEAGRAMSKGEVPVGAVLLDAEGRFLAAAHNRPISAVDPTAHAEILALRAAAGRVGNYRLPGAILICTLEPCLMCLGALVQARVQGVVFGANDPKSGALVSRLNCRRDLDWLNHRFWVVEGVLRDQCRDLLQEFFATRRQQSGEVAKSGHNAPDSKSGWR